MQTELEIYQNAINALKSLCCYAIGSPSLTTFYALKRGMLKDKMYPYWRAKGVLRIREMRYHRAKV